MYRLNLEKAAKMTKNLTNKGMTLNQAINHIADTEFLFDDEIKELHEYFNNKESA